LEAIETDNAALQAAMAGVRQDDGPNGKRSNFEDDVAHLLPSDPVTKKRAAGVRQGANNISDATIPDTTGFGSKPSTGKTGVTCVTTAKLSMLL
jgi:hypothetical protein